MAILIERRNLALLALGAISLLAGLTGALVLLGVAMPGSTAHLAAAHGLLMALGFLGTMIALERAVALRSWWGFLAPLGAGTGALALILGLPDALAGTLLLGGGVIFVALYVAFDRIEVTLYTRTQALGALAWPVAVVLWLAGRPIGDIVIWLAAFLILTIAGERLELSRLGNLAPRARMTFIGATLLLSGGVLLSVLLPAVGWRVAGAGLLALAAWLAQHDIARRTVHVPGVTRYIGLCLLAGYIWLGIAGALWLAFGYAAGAPFDAQLHAVFLGFVMSMVFGHATIIIPAVLRVALPYHQRFYVHLSVLHVGLVLRIVAGDLFGSVTLWQWGGVLNVVALLLFVASSAGAVLQEVSRRRSLNYRTGGIHDRQHRRTSPERAGRT